MGLDPLSPVAPARIKLLLIPVGRIRQSRFAAFSARLQQDHVVRLGDVSPDSRPHRTLFSPLAFPEGLIIYDLITAIPPLSQLTLGPFEFYRQPLLIVGLLDGLDEDGEILSKRMGREAPDPIDGEEHLRRSLDDLRADFPGALLHHLLIFDHHKGEGSLPEGVMSVPSLQNSRSTTVKTVMCDMTSRLLGEFAATAKKLQSGSSVETPKASNALAPNDRGVSALPSYLSSSSRASFSSERSRSFSPAGDDSRSSHRASLPVALPINGTSQSTGPDSRVASPASGSRTPPTAIIETSQSPSAPLPLSTQESNQDKSRRASLERRHRRLRSDSLGDRDKVKAKGRIGVIMGSMYLLAGRWPDAAKELVQSANVTRSNSDYVWQAKALDYLLVCLLMYAWSGMDFRIPDVLRPGAERPGSNSSKSNIQKTSSGFPQKPLSNNDDPSSRLAVLNSLAETLPDVVNNILNLYSRAWTFTEEKIPPLSYSHSTLRFAKLLAVIKREHGNLNENVLKRIVLNKASRNATTSETKPSMSMPELSNLLFRAYPTPLIENTIPLSERANILAAISSVLSELGYHRKQAVVLKELLSSLLPALVQARKDGAAEMGVHPAASLSSLNTITSNNFAERSGPKEDDAEQAMQSFLSLICQSFGVSLKDWIMASNETGGSIDIEASIGGTTNSVDFAIQQASMAYVGNEDLKIDILRSCINICEALPNLAGALQFSAELLRTAGSGIAPGPESSNASPSLPIEEQMRLANNIARTLGAAQHLGLRHPEANYWDEFLVRGVEHIDLNPSKSLVPHDKTELEIAETTETKKQKTPFIYNPYLKANAALVAEPLLVAEEEAVFKVTLQNLYDFDLHIEYIRLEADQACFRSHSQATMIGPYRTQTILLGGIPQQPGKIKVIGCVVKIRGCRERSFSIFKEPWELQIDVKGHNVQSDLGAIETEQPDMIKMKPAMRSQGPAPIHVPIKVIATQPILQLSQISLPQSAIMLLEGEICTFTIKLQNRSQDTPADLIILSFTDSTAPQVQSALASKELSEIEMYELELSVSRKPSFRWLRSNEDRDGTRISPGGEATFEIEVRGKPGLTSGTIQVDYCHLGVPVKDVENSFYTRQLKIPISVTVNTSVDLIRSDLTSLPRDYDLQHRLSLDASSQASELHQPPYDASRMAGISRTSKESKPNGLLLDFRNSWPTALTLSLTHAGQTTLHPILPGTTLRLPLPCPKLYLPPSVSHAPVPALNPATTRQYVVSTFSKQNPEAQLALREAFWFRENLLSQLDAKWAEEGTGRYGEVELRTLRLTNRMVALLRLGDIEIRMTVNTAEPEAPADNMHRVEQRGAHTFCSPTGSFLSLRTTVRNRAETPIRPLLRLQPTLAGQPHNVALDLGKKLLVNGTLQRALPVLNAGEERTVETRFCVLSTGLYEWNACVEELKTSAKVIDGKPRPRAKTGDLDVAAAVGRRVWYSDMPCVVVAHDREAAS